MATRSDMRKLQEFFEYVLERQGFRFFYLHRNQGFPSGPQTAAQLAAAPNHIRLHRRFTLLREMFELGALENRCCFEIGLVKPSLVQHLIT